jgi:hypothetical protein
MFKKKKIKNTKIKNTIYLNKHIPNSFCFDIPNNLFLINNGSLKNLMNEFNEILVQIGKKYNQYRKLNMPMIMTNEDVENFENAKVWPYRT